MKTRNIKNDLFTYLIKHGAEIDSDVFSYGYTTFITYFAYIILVLPIMAILGKFIEVLIFLIFYIPLRRYIGGYHFDSTILCLIFSVIFSIFIPYFASWIGHIQFSIRFFSVILIIILTFLIKAVDHPNKRLNVKEKLIYTNKALIIEILYSLLILVFYNKTTYIYLNIVYLSLIVCFSGIIIARLKMLRYNTYE